MMTYVGYGFDTRNVAAADLITAIRRHDPDWLEEYRVRMQNEKGRQDDAVLAESLDEELAMQDDTRAEFLRDLINNSEGVDVTEAYENYLVFDSLRFGNEKRASLVHNEMEFIIVIGKYIPTAELNFGDLYDGSEWTDPCYTLDWAR